MKLFRHLSAIVIISLLPLLLFNCSDEFLPEGAQISLVRQNLRMLTSSVSFGYNANLTATVAVEGENATWQLTGLPDWLSASATSGRGAGTITLTAKENKSPDDSRAALLKFSSTSADYMYEKTISVSQPSATWFIIPSADMLDFVAAGESKLLNVDSNVDWTAESSATWIATSKSENGQLRITVDENLGTTRKANIYLKRTSTTTTLSTITVTQAEAGVTGSTDKITFDVDGETHTTTIEADASWSAYSSDASWITVSPEGGAAGSATLAITTTANGSVNGRSGYVYVRIGSSDKLSIPINQEGISYEVSVASVNLKSTTESTTFEFEANTSWSVVSKPEWLEVEPDEGGKGTTTVTLTPQDNPDTAPRTGYLVLGREGFSGNRIITIKQEGKNFGDIDFQMDFPSLASTQSLTIDTDGLWTASTSDSWIHLSPASGTGQDALKVAVDTNPGKDERRGTISVSVGKTTQTIAVVQAGSYINIVFDDLLTNSRPATIQLSVLSNAEWTATSSADWMTVSPTSGQENGALTLSVTDNPSVNSRTASVLFKTLAEEKDISFAQPGRTLTLSASSLSFACGGGTSDVVVVTTDGTYTVTASEEWLSVTQRDNTFAVKAEPNLVVEPRTGIITVALTDLKEGESLSRTISVSQDMYSDPLGLCPDTKHPHLIDLGLSVKWACCNMGATSPTGYGDYYAWGEITGANGGKTDFEWSTYKWCQGSASTMTKYCTDSQFGTVDLRIGLLTEDDAAYRNRGAEWRTPSLEQFDELIDASNTTTEWIKQDGVNGYRITSKKNGNSIFLPASGYHNRALLNELAGGGAYWSRTLYLNNSAYAYSLYFGSGKLTTKYNERYYGFNVRPVEYVPEDGTTLSVSHEGSLTDSKPATIKISVTSNTLWSASSSSDWLKLSPSSGQGDATVTLTVADNASPNSRTGKVVVKTASATKEISFTQPGRKLTLSTTSLSFTAAGGTSSAVTVTSDGTYSVTSSATWATVSRSGNTFTVKAAANSGDARTATITVALTDLKEGESLSKTITVTQAKYVDPLSEYCPDGNHPHLIDLGLSVKWSCCNLGSTSPTGYGDYYAWGETVGYNGGKTTFSWSNYKWCNGSSSTLTKYCNSSSYGTVDNKTELDVSDDAAYQNRGSNWCMPSYSHFAELINTSKTSTEWTTLNGVSGCKITSKTTGNSIFLPAAGYRSGTAAYGAGSDCYFWSSSLSTSAPNARHLYCSSNNVTTNYSLRYYGRSIRPVECVKYFNLSYDAALSNSKSASIPVTINTNDSWTASSSATWMTVSSTAGVGSLVVSIHVADNATTNSRTGKVVFKTATETKEVSVTQPGRSLTLSISTLSFMAIGGTSNTITVTTDGTYTISSSATWAAISKNGNTFTVRASANSGVARSATITVALTNLSSGSLSKTISVTQEKYTPPTIEYVDLGLPSGTLWATFNLGASAPEDYGDYFAWGETSGYKAGKSDFSWSTYMYCNGSGSTLTKYCTDSSHGTVDGKEVLDMDDDAAYAAWGTNWRIPSLTQFQELLNSSCTTTEWTTVNGIYGRRITSKVSGYAGKSIFLPASGSRYTSSFGSVGTYGYYWSRNIGTNSNDYASALYFNSGGIGTGNYYRYGGRSIRPVQSK